eukprot:119437_1
MEESSVPKWKQSWRAMDDVGKWWYLKRAWFLGMQSVGLIGMMYYFKEYRQDLPKVQKQAMIACGAGYVLRDQLAFLYTQNTKPIKKEDLFNVILGHSIYAIPAYLAVSNAKYTETTNKIIYGTSLALSVAGHLFNSFGELQRKWWCAKPENKGRVYTQGFFSITRHPNYFGDVLFTSGWMLLSYNYKSFALIVMEIYGFFNEYIPELEQFMESKHGKEWIQYKQKVKSSLFPFIPI